MQGDDLANEISQSVGLPDMPCTIAIYYMNLFRNF